MNPSSQEPASISFAAELKRKAIHLVALVVPLGMAWLGKTNALLVLLPAAALALAADVLRVRSERFASLIRRVFGSMMREEELPPVGASVSINGATWVLLSAVLLTLAFPIPIAAPTFAMFMVADAVAAIVGRGFGRIHWGSSRRTVEGSLAFFGTGLLLMAFVPSIPFWVSAIGVAVACGAEALPKPFNDNLRVPFLAATVIFLLGRFVAGMDVTLFFY